MASAWMARENGPRLPFEAMLSQPAKQGRGWFLKTTRSLVEIKPVPCLIVSTAGRQSAIEAGGQHER